MRAQFPSKKIEGGKYRYEVSPGKWMSRQWVSLMKKLGNLSMDNAARDSVTPSAQVSRHGRRLRPHVRIK